VGVGLGELVAYSLGSCVAICLYDPLKKVAGMAHVVPEKGAGAAPGKFGDTAVPALLYAMQQAGAAPVRLDCRLAGGAAVLAIGGTGRLPPIGQRNVQAVKAALERARLRVRAEDTGGTQGRTVRLDAATGCVTVRKVSGPEEEL
jgi:chemotaxis protein CheD